MNIRNIRELKQTAAARLESAPLAKNIVLIYAGITVGLSALVTVVNYCLGLSIDQMGGLSNMGTRSVLSTIQTLLPMIQSFLIMALDLGYLAAALRISRGQYTSPNAMRRGAERFWPMFRLTLLQSAIYFGLMLVCVYAATYIFLLTPLSNDATELLMPMMGSITGMSTEAMMLDEGFELLLMQSMLPLFVIVFVLYAVFMIPIFYQLRMSSYVLVDASQPGALAALRESRKLMRGSKFALFRLDLSHWWFFGLSLLASAVCYGDVLLPMVGVTLPWSGTVSYFVFYALFLVMRFCIAFLFQNKISVTYALAYEAVKPVEKKPESSVVLGNIFQM